MTDEPETLPTPFTAEQIQAASPPGHTMLTRTEDADGTATFRRIEFVSCDADGAAMRTTAVDADGTAVGESHEGRATWVELQHHAAFPAAATTHVTERLETPLGTLDCLRYDVEAGNAQMTFWFAIDHPGMPVRHTVQRDGVTESTTSIIAIN